MYRLLFGTVILFLFITAQSWALVCKASCLTQTTSHSAEKSKSSRMPDCHSSEKKQEGAPEKEPHSCSKSCQTDLLERSSQALKKVASESLGKGSFMVGRESHQILHAYVNRFEVGGGKESSPPFQECLLLIQQKFLI